MKLPNDLTKLYYSMSEVTEIFSVNASLIRYWDKEFPSLRPHKNRKGDRRFTKGDLEELNKIYTLVKERGFTIEGAKKELAQGFSHPYDNQVELLTGLIRRLESIRLRAKLFNSKL